MKKVLVICIAVGMFATACDWMKPKQEEPEIVTFDDIGNDSLVTTNDSTAVKDDSTVAAVEPSTTETKKETK